MFEDGGACGGYRCLVLQLWVWLRSLVVLAMVARWWGFGCVGWMLSGYGAGGLCWLVAVMMGGYERGSIGNGWCTRVDDGCPGWCLERLWPKMIGLDTSVMGDIVMCRSSYGAWWWSKMVGLDTLAIEVIGSLRRLEGEGGKRRSNHWKMTLVFGSDWSSNKS